MPNVLFVTFYIFTFYAFARPSRRPAAALGPRVTLLPGVVDVGGGLVGAERLLVLHGMVGLLGGGAAALVDGVVGVELARAVLRVGRGLFRLVRRLLRDRLVAV